MKNSFDAIIRKFGREMRLTHKLWAEYEGLRPQYEALKKYRSGKTLDKFSRVSVAMQVIEMKIEKIWKPHSKTIGVCTKCAGTRMPAVMGKKKGLGCFNSACHHFEVMTKRAS
jgi:hypothetical protein